MLRRVSGFACVVIMDLKFVAEQGFELVRTKIATDHAAHAVGDELDHVIVFGDIGTL